MNPFYYITIILSILLAICYVIILLQKPSQIDKFPRKIVLVLAYGLIGSIIAASFWSEYELSQEVKRLQELQYSISGRSFETLSLTQEQRYQILDSLNIEAEELDAILDAVKRQNTITGGGSKTIDEIYNAKFETQKQHSEIAKYNTIINPSQQRSHRKGYSLKSESSSFTFLPPQQVISDYVDLGLYFQDETIIPKIEVICIDILKINPDNSLSGITTIYYEPQKGLNKFRLKNYFKDSNVYALVGFFWKGDYTNSEYPTFEAVKYAPTKIE